MRSRSIATATAIAASIGIAFSGIGALPASAVGVCDISIECEPEGLAVLADSDAAAAGTGTGTSASESLMADAASATPSGIGGLSWSRLAGAAGRATVVSVGGWQATKAIVGSDGTTGILAGPPWEPGWVGGVNYIDGMKSTFGANGGGWTNARMAAQVVQAPAYGDTSGTIQVMGTIAGSCSGDAWTNPAVMITLWGYDPQDRVVKMSPGIAMRFGTQNGSSLGRNCTGPFAYTDSVTWGGDRDGAWGTGPAWTFDHLELWAWYSGDGVQNKPIDKWFPIGNTARPPTPAASDGTVTQTITCTGPSGDVPVTRTTPVSLLPASIWDLPNIPCPAGSVVKNFGSQYTPGSGGPAQTLTPTTSTPEWVQTIPTQYPACLTETCRTQLRHSSGISCGDLAIDCPDWYLDPNRDTEYVCSWGPYPVDVSYCSVYRDPGHLRPNAIIGADGRMSITPWPTLEIDSDVVGRQIAALSARYDDPTACEVLGEFVRTDVPDASVPDTVLVCESLGIPVGVDFAAQSSSSAASQVTRALVDAVTSPEPLQLNPDCDLIADDGSCADQTVVQPSPEPAPAGSGANKPPKSCLNDVARQDLIRAMPDQYHHMATKYGEWAAKFNDILADVNSRDASATPLSLDDPTRVWNQVLMRHRGPHPAEYHEWVLDNMMRAYADSADTATFLARFSEYISKVVTDDPTIVRVAYWKCYRVKK